MASRQAAMSDRELLLHLCAEHGEARVREVLDGIP
jgi:hypothetical protein